MAEQEKPRLETETKKEYIKNRKGEKVSILIDVVQNQRGVIFIMPGLGGRKEQVQLTHLARTANKAGYTDIRFDPTNNLGESDGRYENATATGFYEDLEDVLAWAKTQPWYQEPFILAGHSLSGMCTTLYAEGHPKQIKARLTIGTVVSGDLSASKYRPEALAAWEKQGYEEREVAGTTQRLNWEHMADRLKYNALAQADKLTMPALMFVGDQDNKTPLEHQRMLAEATPGSVTFHVMNGTEHTLRSEKELAELDLVTERWLASL